MMTVSKNWKVLGKEGFQNVYGKALDFCWGNGIKP